MTYISTGLSVLTNNNKLVYADINNDTGLISIDDIIKKITKKTKVIIPVHLYGYSSKITEIKKISKIWADTGIKGIKEKLAYSLCLLKSETMRMLVTTSLTSTICFAS